MTNDTIKSHQLVYKGCGNLAGFDDGKHSILKLSKNVGNLIAAATCVFVAFMCESLGSQYSVMVARSLIYSIPL
jgi:hypothetical protein